MSEEDLRDCFAMFAMLGMVSREGCKPNLADGAYLMADAMLQARKQKESDDEESDVGIARVAKRTYKRKG